MEAMTQSSMISPLKITEEGLHLRIHLKRMGEDFEHLKLSAIDEENNDIALFSIFSMLGAAFALKPLGHTYP